MQKYVFTGRLKVDLMNFIDIVREICAKNSTDCRSLNKSDLARKLMDMANVPDDAEITEIPLDVDNQVAILFVVPNDDKYFFICSDEI